MKLRLSIVVTLCVSGMEYEVYFNINGNSQRD